MKTPIRKVLDEYSDSVSGFKPNPIFYSRVGINHKRFYQILRGEKEPLVSELKNLSNFFKVPISELI